MKARRTSSIAARAAALALTVTVLATAAPATAAVISDSSADPIAAKFASRLEPKPAPVAKIARVLVVEAPASAAASTKSAVRVEEQSEQAAEELTTASTKAQAPVVAAAPKPAATSSTPVARTGSSTGELAQAKAILAQYVSKYPILQGATVTIGDTPNGYQAVSYYQSGRIVINTNHTVSLERILAHEIWHIIDWRDNGQIDWGENIPPK
jgi:hypothetical protein